MPIVATAGHVDHGKSTLVEALTGRDPDRWAEEKERGLTIDLGFAWADIGGHEVGFVDVPGHEKFIKNMLAGVGAVDVALFVVAADEGWMPQSEEHLAILDLLDTRFGVIALTRVDVAEADAVDLAELEIMEAVEGPALGGWPIVRVSPTAGTGMGALRRVLADVLESAGEPTNDHRPRLWVDRSFRISGAGLVVTGTLVGGTVATGDELTLWPGGVPVRVRGLQQHDSAVDELGPGTRAALNITGADDVARGHMLGESTAFATTTEFLALLRPVRELDGELPLRGAFHLHVGTGVWPMRLRVIAEEATGVACLIRTDDAVAIHSGDRLVVRETGRRAVVAGGRVLDPHPQGRGPDLRAAVPELVAALAGGPNPIADALLHVRGIATIDELRRDSGGGTPSSPFSTGTEVMAPDAATALLENAVAAVSAFHDQNRLRPGIPKASLISALGVSSEVLTMVVAGADVLSDDGATIRLTDFDPGLTRREQEAWDRAQTQLAAAIAVPRASQLGLDSELLHALVRDERLVRVGDDLVFLPEQIVAVRAALDQLDGEFTVAQ